MSDPIAIVAAAIVLRGGRVLLTRRREGDRFAGQWELPGGKVDPGEAPAGALSRELLEEIGTKPYGARPYQFAYHEYERPHGDPRGPLRVLLLFYLCEIEGEPQTLEVAECRWVPLEDLTDHEILKGSVPVLEQLARDAQEGRLG